MISTHTPRVERDIISEPQEIDFEDFNSHAPCGAWPYWDITFTVPVFISTHTPRVERDKFDENLVSIIKISTHTPRVERDCIICYSFIYKIIFQLTRPVWSVTRISNSNIIRFGISTHTPRVERDEFNDSFFRPLGNFNSHAPCGAWHDCSAS